MKKASDFSIVFYLLFLVCLYLVFNQYAGEVRSYFLPFVLLAFLLNIVLLELGHIVGAKAGGYGVYSISLIGLTICKIGGKWKVKIDGEYCGVTGETKIYPKKETANPKLYCWMSSLFILIEIIGLLLLPIVIEEINPKLEYFGYISVVVGAVILVCNVIPLHFSSLNDAFILKSVNKDNVTYFNNMLLTTYNLYQGEELKENDVYEKVDAVFVRQHYYAYLEKIYKEDYDGALKIIDNLIEHSNQLYDDWFVELMPAKLFILTMTKSKEEVEEFLKLYTTQDRKTINSCASIEGSRNYFSFVAFVVGDLIEARKAYRKFIKYKTKLKEIGRLNQETKIMDQVLLRLKEEHPDWDLNKETDE